MGFDLLLGNQRLKDNLVQSLAKGRISHFYLISGPAGSGKRTLARLLAAAILCREGDRPCGRCLPCRKAMEGNHPDLITVTDPDHKNVAVKLVRRIREDVFIRPNESDYKIYLFPQELGLEGQNALLKILEEPPRYGVFILLSDNPEKLLPTVRSRCTELALQGLPVPLLQDTLSRKFPNAAPETIQAAASRSGGYLGQAMDLLTQEDTTPPQTEQFVRSFAARDPLGLAQTLVPMEKWKRDQLLALLQSWVALLSEALTGRAGLPTLSPLARQLSDSRRTAELMDAVAVLRQAMDYTQSNVSPAAVCGWLVWALSDRNSNQNGFI